jgi:hypothetical protein
MFAEDACIMLMVTIAEEHEGLCSECYEDLLDEDFFF